MSNIFLLENGSNGAKWAQSAMKLHWQQEMVNGTKIPSPLMNHHAERGLEACL